MSKNAILDGLLQQKSIPSYLSKSVLTLAPIAYLGKRGKISTVYMCAW